MSTVALALSDGVPLYELAAPCAIFGTDRSEITGAGWYDFQVCGPPGARVDQWFRSTSERGYEDLVAADTVVVPACHDGDQCPPGELVEAVRAAYDRGARVMSICTGAFVLAAAGRNHVTEHQLLPVVVAVRVKPDFAAAHNNLGMALCQQG